MAYAPIDVPSKRRIDPSPLDGSQERPHSPSNSSGHLKATCPGSSLTGKKRKISSSSRTDSPQVEIVDTMYNFSNATRNGHGGVIDLTEPGPTSPKHRRISSGVRMEQFNPHAGTKKLLVKNLRTTPKSDPDVYCAQTMKKLEEALSAIFTDQRPQLSNEELYKGVENLCKFKRAPEVTDLLTRKCYDHVSRTLRKQISDCLDKEDVAVLQTVVSAWNKWNRQLLTIRSIFFYLDRAYLLQTSNRSIHEMGVGQYRDLLYGEKAIQQKVIKGECDLLLAQRTSESFDSSLFQEGIKMLHELSVYNRDFEPQMLGLSQDYISAWSDQAIVDKEPPIYVLESVKLIDSELARCDRYELDASTKRALLTLLEHHLIERRESDLTSQDAIADMLDDGNINSLNQLYRLLERRKLGGRLKPAFSKWIEDTGTAIVFDEKGQDGMVVKLLGLKQNLDDIWRKAFKQHEELGIALRESFSLFINKSKKTSATWGTDNSKPAEMIAKYVDSLLKQGAKVIPTALAASSVVENEEGEDRGADDDAKVNEQLDQVLDLFRFVQGKAVFEAFYKKDLARRLLLGRSASYDAERSMLTRLKTECGAQFTQNLEQMFRDVELGREEMSAYKSRGEMNENKDEIDLSVSILSAAAWPSYPDVPVVIPPEIARVQDRFSRYYLSKHTNRKLFWKHALAHCVIRASFPRGTKEMVVSSFQAVVLLMFSGRGGNEHIGYAQVKAEAGLDDEETKRTLQSLACAKLRPLTKHPKGRDINDTDTFTVNSDFTHDKFRFKINSIQQKETKEENKATHERVAADRQFETQAAVVRIMKSRKTIHHAELIAEVISATRSRGVLSVADIKKNIDRLVEKEYMERADGNSYNYLA